MSEKHLLCKVRCRVRHFRTDITSDRPGEDAADWTGASVERATCSAGFCHGARRRAMCKAGVERQGARPSRNRVRIYPGPIHAVCFLLYTTDTYLDLGF